ncbi:MAG: LytTR family transcriptional regulator [Saprospiraceae bacterium]|nr:LytTR family transcriptional regulator [Candidatus Defluviibacterium haderslevense]
MFYYHTYSIQQTLRYAISEYVYLLVLFYTIPVLVFQFFTNKTHPNETVVDEILYCSANPPYITLHLDGKKYLHTEPLKSISFRLNPNQFVRIHKSTIVNIDRVVSYTTRLNGDYDLTLKNNVQLRLSRNYSTDFKNQFNKTHQLTTK